MASDSLKFRLYGHSAAIDIGVCFTHRESRMTVRRNDLHSQQVQTWMEKNTTGLSQDQLVLLFGAAIHAIEQRSLITLSRVTVEVVIDRVLFESKERFPVLEEISTDQSRLNLIGLLHKSGERKYEGLREALKYLLTELLRVIGNITADVLTEPLHKELMAVTCDRALTVGEVQSLSARRSAKANRGES